MARVFTLQSNEIREFWPLIEHFLLKVENPDWTLEGARQELEEARAQLWGMAEGREILAVWVTKLEETSKGRRGLLWIAAGSGLEQGLKLFSEHTEPWFKEKGCKSVQILGRRGWKKVLDGYDDVGVVLVKDLA